MIASATRHPQLTHAKRQHQRKVRRGDVPGLKSVARATAAPRLDQGARGRLLRLPEEQHRPGSSVATVSDAGQRRDSLVGDRGEMIGRRRAELRGELRSATRLELVRVQLEAKPGVARGGEDRARLVDGEDTRLAEDISEAGKPAPRDRRAASRESADRCNSARRRAARRYSCGISCAPSHVGDNAQRHALGEAADDTKRLELIVQRQAVARLDFQVVAP